MVNFIRRSWDRFSRLGKRRKKKQVWRRPTGRHNKMRDKKRGYPPLVSIGYRSKKEERGKIEKMTPIRVNNLKDLEKIKKDNIISIGRMGKKKKIELCKKAQEKGIKIYKINLRKFLGENKK